MALDYRDGIKKQRRRKLERRSEKRRTDSNTRKRVRDFYTPLV